MLKGLKVLILMMGVICFFQHHVMAAELLAGIQFEVPTSWEKEQPKSRMRAFQFKVSGEGSDAAEMVVFYFGKNMGGSKQANIVRWKGQFTKLESEETEDIIANDVPVTVVTLSGEFQPSGGPMMMAQGPPISGYRVIATIVEGPEGPIFFKLMGDLKTVSYARESLDQMIQSIRKG